MNESEDIGLIALRAGGVAVMDEALIKDVKKEIEALKLRVKLGEIERYEYILSYDGIPKSSELDND